MLHVVLNDHILAQFSNLKIEIFLKQLSENDLITHIDSNGEVAEVMERPVLQKQATYYPNEEVDLIKVCILNKFLAYRKNASFFSFN